MLWDKKKKPCVFEVNFLIREVKNKSEIHIAYSAFYEADVLCDSGSNISF